MDDADGDATAGVDESVGVNCRSCGLFFPGEKKNFSYKAGGGGGAGVAAVRFLDRMIESNQTANKSVSEDVFVCERCQQFLARADTHVL